jgi:hypothetical protein
MKLMYVMYDRFLSLLRWIAGIRRMLSALVLMFGMLFTMGFGCSAFNTSSPVLFFPVQQEGLAQMLILAKGKLVVENGCLRLKPIIGHSRLLIWPYGYSLHTEGKIIEVVNGDGKTVARVGDTIKVGGGPAVSAEIVEIYTGKQPPDECPGLYWLVSEVIDN